MHALLDSTQVDVICLQETKMMDVSRFFILWLLGITFETFVFLPSVGASGGVLVAWKNTLVLWGQ